MQGGLGQFVDCPMPASGEQGVQRGQQVVTVVAAADGAQELALGEASLLGQLTPAISAECAGGLLLGVGVAHGWFPFGTIV